MKVHSNSIRNFIDCVKEVPNELLSERMAQRNHGQSLQTLNERGGMSIGEIWANILEERYDTNNDTQEGADKLKDLIQS